MGNRDVSSDALRDDLIDRLVGAGTIRSAEVERAMRAIPRHRFVPDLDPVAVHEDRAQLVKGGGSGTLSTISQPTMVAIMLELASLRPGERVLEIGTGTGYNAALLGELVGPAGTVVSVDVEADLVESAGDTLEELGLDNVTVLVADGRSGWSAGAPYDCVIATAGVESVPDSWRAQTAVGGRLLAPLLTEQTLVVERRDEAGWRTVATSPAAFIPLR